LIHRIVAGEALEAASAGALDRLEREPEHDETSRAVRRAMDLAREAEPSAETVERLGDGWVGEEALAIALYCALVHPDDLAAAVILAANHSGDTDAPRPSPATSWARGAARPLFPTAGWQSWSCATRSSGWRPTWRWATTRRPSGGVAIRRSR
jgi:hypothetical protein